MAVSAGTDERHLRPKDVPTEPSSRRPAAIGSLARMTTAIGSRSVAALRAVPGLVRTLPFTTAMVLAMLLVGGLIHVVIGGSPDELGARIGYGLSALQDGQFWKFGVGAVVLPDATMYLVMCPLVAVAVGYYERQVGAARSAVALLGTHLIGTVGVAFALAGAGQLSWPWAQLVAGQTDLGMSAGTIGLLGAATCLMSAPIRRRVRWVVSAYLLVMVLRSGLLWDAEHLVGWTAGLLAGPVLAGRRSADVSAGRIPRIKRVRTAIAWAMVVLAVSRLVTAIYPGNGGIFGNGLTADTGHLGALAPALIFVGVVLVVANALRRGLPLAWWAALAVAALAVTRAAVAHPGHASADLLLWGLLLAALVATRGYWPWRLPTGALRRALPRLLIAVGVFIAGSSMVLWVLRSQLAGADEGVRAHQVVARALFQDGGFAAHTRTAHTILLLTTWAWAIALIFLLVPLLYAADVPGRLDRGRRDGRLPARDRMIAMIRRNGGGNLGWQRSWPAFRGWFCAAGDVAVGYRVVSGVAIAIGDPVGPRHRWKAAAAEFQRFCLRSGWTPAWYSVTDKFLAATGNAWQHTQIGEDAVIELTELAFTGKSWQDVRTARNRAEREGIRFQVVDQATADPNVLAGIDEVSRAWADGKPLPEMGFTLGTVELARDGVMRTHVAVGDDGVVHGVTTWMPVHDGGRVVGWTLDVMRRRTDGFRPVMEFLIAESALAFQREGYDFVSLSVAPLARPVGDSGSVPMDRLARGLDRMGEMLEPAYGFRSLLAYKTKFHPRFEPVHLAYGFQADLAEIAVAIGRAYLPNLSAGQALAVAKVLRPGRREPLAAAAA